MVEIKIEREEIVFRIVLAGSDRATKFASLRVAHELLADEDPESLAVLHAGGDRVVGFRYRPTVPPVFGMTIAMQLLAIPGPLRSRANQRLLLRAADAVIFLDDRDPTTTEVEPLGYRELLDELRALDRDPEESPLFVQCYADAGEHRPSLYRARDERWEPELRVAGDGSADGVATLREVEARIIARFRRWERELRRDGYGEGHIKICGQIYEKVAVPLTYREGLPTTPLEEREVRLIRSLEAPSWLRFRGRHLQALLLAVVLAGAAAAALVSVMI